MNPARLFRKSVAALNDWFEKAEREEMEQRLEVLGSPPEPRPSRERVGRDLDGSKVIDFRGTEPPPAGIAEFVPAHSGRNTPLPAGSYTNPNNTPIPGNYAGTPPIKPRSENHTPFPDEIVFAPRNDPQFRARNRMVREIGEKYSRFGDAVASVVLQKCLIADGVQMLATKIGLSPHGDDEEDHQQIIQFIETHGPAKFAELIGVRGAVKTPPKQTPPPGERIKVAQNISGQGNRAAGESHVLQMESLNVKPVSLTASTQAPREKRTDPNPTPSLPLAPAKAKVLPLTPFPFTHSPATPPDEFHEPKRPEPKDPVGPSNKGENAVPDPARPAAMLQRVKAAPIRPARREPPKEKKERNAEDFLREVTQEED